MCEQVATKCERVGESSKCVSVWQVGASVSLSVATVQMCEQVARGCERVGEGDKCMSRWQGGASVSLSVATVCAGGQGV